ncbi:protein of unknown function [Pararobbsia alpina]
MDAVGVPTTGSVAAEADAAGDADNALRDDTIEAITPIEAKKRRRCIASTQGQYLKLREHTSTIDRATAKRRTAAPAQASLRTRTSIAFALTRKWRPNCTGWPGRVVANVLPISSRLAARYNPPHSA